MHTEHQATLPIKTGGTDKALPAVVMALELAAGLSRQHVDIIAHQDIISDAARRGTETG